MGISNLKTEDIEKHLVLTEILLTDIAEILENSDKFVPYIGATKNVDLGSYNLKTTGTVEADQLVVVGVTADDIRGTSGGDLLMASDLDFG